MTCGGEALEVGQLANQWIMWEIQVEKVVKLTNPRWDGADQSVVGKVEWLQPREAGQGCSCDGPRKATPREPQRGDAAARAIAANTFPDAARGAGPRGAEEDPSATNVLGKAPQGTEVIGVATRRCRARRWQEEPQEEQQQPHGFS
jgi:hypothetical protein